MKALVTVSDMDRIALVVDLESGEVVHVVESRAEFFDFSISDRAPCRPFGITWHDGCVYISNNRQLLVYGRDLEFVRMMPLSLQINTHQASYHDGRVWVVSPWTNSVIGVPLEEGRRAVELDLMEHCLRDYLERVEIEENDSHHFNSLLWADGMLYIAAHAHGEESFIYQYNSSDFRLERVHHGAGYSMHGLAKHRDYLYWISTETGEIRGSSGLKLPITRMGYGRGLAVTEHHFIVAVSERLSRGARHTGDSWIQVIDRESHAVLREVHLYSTGSINDLRLLDEHDYGHRIDPWDLSLP